MQQFLRRSLVFWKRTRPFLLCVSLTLLGLGASSTFAQTTIVNWGGAYVSSSVDLDGKNADSSGLSVGRNFSAATPMSPDPASPYSGASATFYGGAVTTRTTAAGTGGWDQFRVQNQGDNDMLDFQIIQGAQGNQHNFQMVAFWDKADFAPPFNSTAVTFSDVSLYSISITNANSSMNDATGRWLVREGSTFFLSQATFVPANGAHQFTPYDVGTSSNGNWASYAPSGLAIDFDQSTASFNQQTFGNITAVGFYLEHDSFRDNFSWSIPGFSVTAVPEPGAIGLFGAVSASWLFARWRRRSKQLEAELPPIN